MSNIFLVYDQQGNIQTATTQYPPVTPPAQLFVADDTTPNAQAALANRQNYMVQNGQIVPAVSLDIERTATQNGRWDQYMLTIKASDNGAHQVNLNIGGNQQTVTTPATVNVNLHNSLSSAHVPVVANGTGVIEQDSFIGGNSTATTIQTYVDANGLLHVTPVSKGYLIGFYTSQVSPTSALADIATAIGLLLQTVYGDVVPALTGAATPLLTLDDNQKNALADLQTNIVSKVQTTLENAAPKPASGAEQTYDLHYASLSRHWVILETAFQNYAADLDELPNLVG